MKRKGTSLAATFLLALIPAVCCAQDFSADVVYVTRGKPVAPSTGTGTGTGTGTLPHQSSKLYVSKDKMRLETRGLTGTILLVDGVEHTSIAMFPARKAYQPLASGPSAYFRVQDAEDACPDWQKAADQKIICEKVGHEMVDGRQTVKYQNKSASADATTAAVWIDPTLNFPIKWEGPNTGAELHNIKEGQQSADLFAIPQGYGALKPQKTQLRVTGRTK
jgi:hypothetical protein